MGEKALIIGGGGREHAMGWSIAQDPSVEIVFYAPGNPGTAMDEKCRNADINGAKKENFGSIADLVERESIGMIVVGPEQPLVEGITDFFYARGFHGIFGPTAAAAMLEADKFYSYNLMEWTDVPQADTILCATTEQAEKAIKKMATSDGVVIKARGLTGGKGVYVCGSADEALSLLGKHAAEFKSPEVLIARRLSGEEFSVFGISDGENVLPFLISVQDHKRLLNNDTGPNTGGMGAYCPAPIADATIVRQVADKMMTPVVQEMKRRGEEFKGFLYAGCIMTKDGPKIIEYNVRLGDPETQPLMMMLKGGIYRPIKHALDGKLDEIKLEFKPGAACCVVMAANGYPGKIEKGYIIGGLEEAANLPGVKIFHAGTGLDEHGEIIGTGGRVLGVTGYSGQPFNSLTISGIHTAQYNAYGAVRAIDQATREKNNRINFTFRNDIAEKAMMPRK